MSQISPPPAPNLLIVDDDETIQRLLFIAAQDLGWRPVAVGNGQAGLDTLDPRIEAVILDHGMPGMDGLQTLRRIRESAPAVPVIMLTGLNDAETAVQALRAGADDYLTKPFELKRLFDLLRQARLSRKDTRELAVPAEASAPRPRKSSALHSENPQLKKLLVQLSKAAATMIVE